MRTNLYCPMCSNYLMIGDSGHWYCSCGWKQPPGGHENYGDEIQQLRNQLEDYKTACEQKQEIIYGLAKQVEGADVFDETVTVVQTVRPATDSRIAEADLHLFQPPEEIRRLRKQVADQQAELEKLKAKCEAWKDAAEYHYGQTRIANYGQSERDYPVKGALDAWAKGQYRILRDD